MSTELATSLIAQLDPERDYGPRSYDEVVAGTKSGEITVYPPLEPGRPPILRLTSSGALIKGSGPPWAGGGSPQTALQARLVEWADHQGLEVAIGRLLDIMLTGDEAVAAKAIDIFLKYTMPKAREAAPDDSIAVKLLEALMTTREARPVTVYEVNQ